MSVCCDSITLWCVVVSFNYSIVRVLFCSVQWSSLTDSIVVFYVCRALRMACFVVNGRYQELWLLTLFPSWIEFYDADDIFILISSCTYPCLDVMALKQTAWHDDVIKWKHFPRYWPFVRRIHRSPVNSPHKGQWRGALMFSLIRARINGWVNNRKAGDLTRHQVHCDVIVMIFYGLTVLGLGNVFYIYIR